MEFSGIIILLQHLVMEEVMNRLIILKLFDANENAGSLSATYVLKNDSSKIITTRNEDSIAYDYLSDLKNFPAFICIG